MSTDVADLVKRIRTLPIEKRREFLQVLPTALGLTSEDLGWLKATETAFGFWENPEDEVYDHLQVR
ncbi:MAG: hypothetical protein HYT87_11325 [Nitrospirae bacterium]|nr:hypothetical protein [Nitrospirota bacterium]